MKKKYVIWLLTFLMVLSPAAAFADVEGGTASDEAASVETVQDAPAAEEAAAPEAPAAEEAAAPETQAAGTEDAAPAAEEKTGWDDEMTHYYKEGVVQTGLFKAPKRTDQSINTMYFASETGAIHTVGGPVTVTADMTKNFYRFEDKGTTSGYGVQENEKGPLTYFVYTVDGDCDIMPKEGLYQANQAHYYIQADGTVRTAAGVIEYNSAKYYVQEGGEILMKAGFTPDHKYYIPAADGKILTTEGAFKAADGKLYYAAAGGEIPSKEGLYGTGSNQYYVYADGSVKTDAGFITVDGKKYLVKAGGEIRRTAGSFKYNGNYYVAEEGGAIITTRGLYKVDGKIYFVKNKEGVCSVSKAFKYNGKSYHSKADGTIAVGVHKWGKKQNRYYSKSTGEVRKKAGIVKWNNKRYHVNKYGKVTTSKKFVYKKKTYIAGKYGVICTKIFTWKKNKYYANSKGELRTKAGLFKYDGNRYYSKKGGILYRNTLFSAGGKKYLAQKDATIKIGYFTWKNNHYLTNDTGAIYTKEGIYRYNKTDYFVKSGGAMAKNEFVAYGKDSSGNDIHYFVNSDGSIAKKKFTYTKGGKKYTITPNSKTGKISLEDYWKVFPDEKPAEEDAEE